MLTEAVQTEHRHSLRRLFRLLGLIQEQDAIAAVYDNLESDDARRQANAIEVLDQLLQGDLRQRVTAALEGEGPIREADADASLGRLYRQGGEWVRLCVYHLACDSPGRWPRTYGLVQERGHGYRKDHVTEIRRKVRLLRTVRLFARLEGQELAMLAEPMQEVIAEAGEPIVREGMPGDALYVLEEGEAVVERGGDVFGSLAAGACFGETALLDGGVRTATVRAQTAMRLWRLDSKTFFEVAFDHAGIAMELIRMLSGRIREENDNRAGSAGNAGRGGVTLTEKETAAGRENDAMERLQGEGGLLRKVLVLQQIELFAAFPFEELARLGKRVQVELAAAGERLVKEGEAGDSLFAVIRGRIRVHRGSQTLASLGPGEVFGEMALIDGGTRSADCTCEEDSELLQLKRDTVFAFCFERPDVLRGLVRMLVRRLRSAQAL